MRSARETFEAIRGQASKATGGADSFRCCCPAHDDHSPSLSVTHDTDRVLLHCWTGCAPEDVCRAFGLELAELFDPDHDREYAVPAPPSPKLYAVPDTPQRQNHRDEARAIASEQRAHEAQLAPIPCSELAASIDALRRPYCDARRIIVTLRALALGEEWSHFDGTERAILTGWASNRAGQTWRPAIAQTLGTVDRDGTHHPAPLPAPTPARQPATLADVKAVETVKAIAHDVWYAGRLGLIHGPAGGGKSTLMALAAAAVTQGRLFAGRPCHAGMLLVCTEDPETWREVVAGAGGDLSSVRLCAWSDLELQVRELEPAAVAIDTMQYVAHCSGSGELDSAQEVDRILRPLAALTRETGVAITVADHEPWSEGAQGDKNTGTKDRPRHSGAKVATVDFVLRCTAQKDGDGLIQTIEIGPSKAKGARRGITVSREVIGLDGTPRPGGTEAQPVDERQDDIDRAIRGTLEAFPQGLSATAVAKKARVRQSDAAARLRVVGRQCEADGLWKPR